MPSFKTTYRAAVMIATVVIVVKGWQLYGPSTDRIKNFAVAAIEAAQTAWNKPHVESAQDSENPADPRTSTSPRVAAATGSPVDATPPVSAPGLILPLPSADVTTGDVAAERAGGGNPTPSLPQDDEPGKKDATADDLPALFSQLTAMGVSDQQLTAWGSSGRLHRFSCRAKLVDTPIHTRHFEAVSERPVAAVEQVVAQVEAWRAAQRERTVMQ
jgi:hypothetical protein